MKNIFVRPDGTPTQISFWGGIILIAAAIYFLGGSIVANLQEGMPPGAK